VLYCNNSNPKISHENAVMKYYIFRVTDSIGQTYFVLNNFCLGYVGFDCNRNRALTEYNSNITQVKYNLFAQAEIPQGTGSDKMLHDLFCKSTRFTSEEIESLYKSVPHFAKTTEEQYSINYEIYYPNTQSSHCYLKEIGGEKIIQ
jgi:hypothetical protein